MNKFILISALFLSVTSSSALASGGKYSCSGKGRFGYVESFEVSGEVGSEGGQNYFTCWVYVDTGKKLFRCLQREALNPLKVTVDFGSTIHFEGLLSPDQYTKPYPGFLNCDYTP